MRSEYEDLVSLKLRQARRREFPITVLKGLFLVAVAVFGFFWLASLLTGCGHSRTIPPQTAAERQKSVDAIWGGHAEARRKKLP